MEARPPREQIAKLAGRWTTQARTGACRSCTFTATVRRRRRRWNRKRSAKPLAGNGTPSRSSLRVGKRKGRGTSPGFSTSIATCRSLKTETKSSIKPERRIVMKKPYGVVTLIAVLMGAILLLQTFKVAAAPPPTGIKNVVLVHGAFADGSGWEAVANILKKDGYNVSVVQHPETSFAEDVKFTKAAIDRQSGPVVLVGHSYGGAVITEAGNDPKVAALVYIE